MKARSQTVGDLQRRNLFAWGGGVGSPAVPSRLTAPVLDLDAFLFFCFAGTDGNKSRPFVSSSR